MSETYKDAYDEFRIKSDVKFDIHVLNSVLDNMDETAKTSLQKEALDAISKNCRSSYVDRFLKRQKIECTDADKFAISRKEAYKIIAGLI